MLSVSSFPPVFVTSIMGFKRGRRGDNVCNYWLAGNCWKKQCRFLHPEPLAQRSERTAPMVWRNSSVSKPQTLPSSDVRATGSSTTGGGLNQKMVICKLWILGKCSYGNGCRNLHSWFHGKGFSLLAKLEGHKNPITGVGISPGVDKLYSASSDGIIRTWDCNSGQCVQDFKIGVEIGSLIIEGSWLFVGIPNMVKIWNFLTNREFSLSGPVGQVHAMAVSACMLFAGAQNGNVLAWKEVASEQNPFEFVFALKGHRKAVVTLIVGVGGKRLFSGSVDKTIMVWDIEKLVCVETLVGHTDVVMSLLCCDGFLLSCSLDRTIKIWVMKEDGRFELTHSHKEDHGIVALCGMQSLNNKPILFCSGNDNIVRLYEMPAFLERGRLFAKEEVRVIETGPQGLFFTGDATGLLTVWKWLPEPLRDSKSEDAKLI